jgi:hypothetical protein
MATDFQKRSRQRKLIYAGCIVALFVFCYFWRTQWVEAKAEELNLREKSRGDVELTSSAVKLLLTGSRGLAVCGLWISAAEKQKKNQWNELEMIIRSATKLQPHFVKPWLHHTWNLSYNVSVEMHDLRDMYFWISRGIELLNEGEHRNHNNPDIRDNIATYYQHKICQSDKTSTMRSLLQLSCINPAKRDPALFQWHTPDDRHLGFRETKEYCELHPGDDTAKARLATMWRNFEVFCKEHPHLIRRLHDGLRAKGQDDRLQFKCKTPDEIVRYLIDNRRIPSLYEEPPEGADFTALTTVPLRSPDSRFPLLPPWRDDSTIPAPQKVYDPTDLNSNSALEDDVDGYAIGKAWHGYAQEPLPPPHLILPAESEPIALKDRTKLRRAPYTTILFRGTAPRSQEYIGERLEDEGWFDEAGWLIPGWFANDRFSSGEPAVVGGGRAWATTAWQKARDMWFRYGVDNNLLYASEAAKKKREDLAKEWREEKGLKPSDPAGPAPNRITEEKEYERWASYMALAMRGVFANQTRVEDHYAKSRAELDPETITVRKKFHEADDYRLNARLDQAIAAYALGLDLWKSMIKKHQTLRDDQAEQEDTYESELRYIGMLQERTGTQRRQTALVGTYLGLATARAAASPAWTGVGELGHIEIMPRVRIIGPIDGYIDEDHKVPYVLDRYKQAVHDRRKGLGGQPPPKFELDMPTGPEMMMMPGGGMRGPSTMPSQAPNPPRGQ